MEALSILEFDIEEIDMEETPQEELKQRFKIQDLGGCDWTLRKLTAINEKETDIENRAKKEIERINEWKAGELKKTEDDKAYFEGLILEYYVEQKQLDPEFKISSPYGKVSSRKQPLKYDYDTDKFIKWAEENERADLIRIKQEVDKKSTKKAFMVNGNQLVDEDTGMVVEGVIVTEVPDKITIKAE